MKKILIVEPYYGGSHKQFLDGLTTNIQADYRLITLPARKWKMRMQLAAPWVVEQIRKMPEPERWFDTVLCSTFVDVAVFSALTKKIRGWNRDIRIKLYLHENQFAYPTRIKDPSYNQFTAINFNSCLTADSLAFNSQFNMETFLAGCTKYLKYATDMSLAATTAQLREKSMVLYPGISFVENRTLPANKRNEPPVIVWNHRWEHDKNPEEFFTTLRNLQQEEVEFRLIILGQSFMNNPLCFKEAQTLFEREIIHFGYASSYEEYIKILGKGDIVVSTALHEFFGIAVIEAVRAGCIPLLPARLSYPELFDAKYLYENGKLRQGLKSLLEVGERLNAEESLQMTDKFSWNSLKEKYENWLLQ